MGDPLYCAVEDVKELAYKVAPSPNHSAEQTAQSATFSEGKVGFERECFFRLRRYLGHTAGFQRDFATAHPYHCLLITFAILGAYLLGTGITILHWKGKIGQALKDIVPNEDDK